MDTQVASDLRDRFARLAHDPDRALPELPVNFRLFSGMALFIADASTLQGEPHRVRIVQRHIQERTHPHAAGPALEELIVLSRVWFDYYNRKRRHSTIHYLTRAERDLGCSTLDQIAALNNAA
jgi:hypothetical protein